MNECVAVEKLGVILKPTARRFEAKAVLNPAVYQDGKFIHLFYRAISKRNISSIGYAKLKGPTEVVERWEEPIIKPQYPYEHRGVEDPRIVKIENTFYLTYVAHDGRNALFAYATSADLKKFKKRGIISPRLTYDKVGKIFKKAKLKDRYFMFEAYYEEFTGKKVLLWEKDALFFPKKIGGEFALIHRVLPDIHIAYAKNPENFKKRKFWREYIEHLHDYVLLENKFWFESRNIGGGAPPVETKHGWIFIFHAVEELNKARVYHAGAALLDKRNPQKIIGRLDHPLFSPEEKWEKNGLVSNVVFPTGTATFGKDLYVYYGAADKTIAVAKIHIPDLIRDLKKKRTPKDGHVHHTI